MIETKEILNKTKHLMELNNKKYKLEQDIENETRQVENLVQGKRDEYIQSSKYYTDKIRQTATLPLMDKFVNLCDQLLIKLISKRVTIKLFDGTPCSISYQGLSIESHRSYWSGETKFKYLPTSYRSRDKLNSYMKILKESDKIAAVIHKKDKKEILQIMGNFARKYEALAKATAESKLYKFDKYIQINYLVDNGRWHNPRFETQNFVFDTILTEQTKDGIVLQFSKNSQVQKKVNLCLAPKYLVLGELLKNEQIEATIKKELIRYEQSNKQLIKAMEEMEEQLQAFTVLEFL